jgi:hypothetical protein
MPQSGVAEFRGDRTQHEERAAARRQARAALLKWDARERELDARERELDARDRERLPSAVRALDDWSSSEHDTVAPAAWSPSGGVPGRRTVTIRGQVADRYATPRPSSRRRPERRYERSGFRPDRAALWAVLLGVMLILAAVTSAHAAPLHTLAHLH